MLFYILLELLNDLGEVETCFLLLVFITKSEYWREICAGDSVSIERKIFNNFFRSNLR